MELRFYTPAMGFIGVMENHSFLCWSRRYFEPGSVELDCPITPDNLTLTALGNIVWLPGSAEAAVIEDRTINDNGIQGTKITAKGRFLSSYMDRRLIVGKLNFNGLTEVAMRQILSSATAIPNVVLGTLNGYAETVRFQATYKNLLDYEEKLAQSASFGFRFRPNFSDKTLTFEVYKGVDRTLAQSVNSRVVFSEMYDNLQSISLREVNQVEKNCVTIGGQIDEDTGTRTYVSFGTSYTGLDRRELFVDARDLSDDGMTAAEYEEVLLQRGHDKLLEYASSTTVECVTEIDSNFRYKTDYDLGDVISVRKNNWGITLDLRITGIDEIYENGNARIVPQFGNPLSTKIDWSDG